jgi:hypothetical protein
MAANDWLSQNEADDLLGIGSSDTSEDTELVAMITAVSERLDKAVGPVVQRTYTDFLLDGGTKTVTPPGPFSSVSSLVAFDGAQTLTYTAESFADVADQYGYLLEPSDEVGLYRAIRARSYGADTRFPIGRSNVKLTYVPGRVANTAAVPARFKLAAKATLENWWQLVRDGVGQDESGEYLVPISTFPEFDIPPAAKALLADVWQDDAVDLLVV